MKMINLNSNNKILYTNSAISAEHEDVVLNTLVMQCGVLLFGALRIRQTSHSQTTYHKHNIISSTIILKIA
jgi:hypothetical protein